MLQGIVNISTNTEHSEIKKDYKLHGKHRAYLNSDSSNDLIVISPAFKYLAKLNWKVESINVNETDKVVISFSVLDYIFKITIDLKLLPHLNKVFFEVKKKIENKSIALIFSVPFVINENENLENFELSNLAILFSRFTYLVRTNEINPLNNKVSFGLYEDLVPGLKGEFQKVLYALLIFVEKLTSKKIMERLNGANRNNPFETIRLENVEVR
jgi:hypothetical protein